MRGYYSGSFAFGAVERIADHGFGRFKGFIAFVTFEIDHGVIIRVGMGKKSKKTIERYWPL